ncbi:MAG: nuclear transport factor 2 family protein [Planctomycetota bacterium]
MPTTATNVRINELLEYVQNGKILEAMDEFYADHVVMTEPAHATEGLAANIEREKQFLASVKEWKGFEVKALATTDDVSIYENVMDWVDTDGNDIHLEQVAVARWENGKIVSERFYYATS